MVKSMTGYGKGEAQCSGKKITVEIRSLNSKQADVSIRIPSIYRPFEYDIRNRVTKALQRGKIDVAISYEATDSVAATTINSELFNTYYKQIKQMACEAGAQEEGLDSAIISTVMRIPEVVRSENTAVADEEVAALNAAVEEALKSIDAFRCQEGAILIDDLLARVDKIEEFKQSVTPFEKQRTETIRTRILDAIASMQLEPDNNRLEQEMIFYFEKLDITEEKIRLSNHCNYFREVSKEDDGVGRKLGFIAQEMGREINTMGSKANDAQIQKLVVMMKDELEKIKEQVLNIL